MNDVWSAPVQPRMLPEPSPAQAQYDTLSPQYDPASPQYSPAPAAPPAAAPRNPWEGQAPAPAAHPAAPANTFVMPTGAVNAPEYKSERKYPRVQNMKGRCLLVIPVEFRTENDPFNPGKMKEIGIAVVTMLNGEPITHHVDADGEMTELAEPFTTNLPVVFYVPWFRILSALKRSQGAAVVGILAKTGKAWELAPAPQQGHVAAGRLLADPGFGTAVQGALSEFRTYEAERDTAPTQSPGKAPF